MNKPYYDPQHVLEERIARLKKRCNKLEAKLAEAESANAALAERHDAMDLRLVDAVSWRQIAEADASNARCDVRALKGKLAEHERREKSMTKLLAISWVALDRSEWEAGPTHSEAKEALSDELANRGLDTPDEIRSELALA